MKKIINEMRGRVAVPATKGTIDIRMIPSEKGWRWTVKLDGHLVDRGLESKYKKAMDKARMAAVSARNKGAE